MEPFLSFVLAHAGVFSGSAGALFATLLHSRLAGRNLLARSLSLALPGFLNTPLAKALAVDVAKAVLAAWDTPGPVTAVQAKDPSGNPVKPTPGS